MPVGIRGRSVTRTSEAGIITPGPNSSCVWRMMASSLVPIGSLLAAGAADGLRLYLRDGGGLLTLGLVARPHVLPANQQRLDAQAPLDLGVQHPAHLGHLLGIARALEADRHAGALVVPERQNEALRHRHPAGARRVVVGDLDDVILGLLLGRVVGDPEALGP